MSQPGTAWLKTSGIKTTTTTTTDVYLKYRVAQVLRHIKIFYQGVYSKGSQSYLLKSQPKADTEAKTVFGMYRV